MTVNYRRTSLDRDTTFYIPKVECFACNDSGIVSNADAAINIIITDLTTISALKNKLIKEKSTELPKPTA